MDRKAACAALALALFPSACDRAVSPAEVPATESFARLFDKLDEITVAVPTGRIEGAGGSTCYTAPIALTARDADGRPVRIEGEAVLRRVTDVDGAGPEQLRWRFDRIAIDWTH